MSKHPDKTGVNKKSHDTLSDSTKIGFAPAGGCKVFVSIIKETPNPTLIAMLMGVTSQ
jgi:hypothetical protein